MVGQPTYSLMDITDKIREIYDPPETPCKPGHSRRWELPSGKKLASLQKAVRRHLGEHYAKSGPYELSKSEFHYLFAEDPLFQAKILDFLGKHEEAAKAKDGYRRQEELRKRRGLATVVRLNDEADAMEWEEERWARTAQWEHDRESLLGQFPPGPERESLFRKLEEDEFAKVMAGELDPRELPKALGEDELLSMMIRALFLKAFPEFNLEELVRDYELLQIAQQYVTLMPPVEPLEGEKRRRAMVDQIKARIDRTMSGDIDPHYLKPDKGGEDG